MKKVIFMGPLYPIEREREILSNIISHSSNAPNVFQWNLLNGLHTLLGDRLSVINVLPVGTWKREYRKLYLRDLEWESSHVVGYEIGSINLPFLKQWHRSIKTCKYLKNNVDENTEIIIYSAYMPFLKAAYRLPANVKITAIITDLPEYYDLNKTSFIRKWLRGLQNRMVYRYLKRVDRFVVLTKQMCIPLNVGDRSWICIEGICNDDQKDVVSVNTDKHVIFYSGTLHYRYGIKSLLDAFKMIKDENVQLWICGSGEAESEIKLLTQNDNRVKFYGFCSPSEVRELRNRSTILVNPRTNEGEYTKYSFPSKTMEYMASAKPIVMYKLAGIPDEYDEYMNYINPDGDAQQELKKTLIDIMNNYDIALQKAQRARCFVLKNKSAIVQAQKIYDFIQENR